MGVICHSVYIRNVNSFNYGGYTIATVSYEIPDDKIKSLNEPEKPKLRTRIKNRVISAKNWIHRNIRKFMIVSALILMIFMIVIIPNPQYHILFDIVFCIILFLVINYLTPMVVLQEIDFETNNTFIIKLSYHRLHDFTILDCDSKPATFVYWLHAGKDRVFLIDAIDFTNDVITLNPICSQLAFVKNFKDANIDLRKKLQMVMNKYEKLKIYRSYEAMVKAGELNDMNPLNAVFTRRKPRLDGEILDTNSIDENNLNNVGKVGD